MPPVSIRLEGTAELDLAFKTYVTKSESGAKRAVATAAKVIETTAKELVPVDEGRLKGSLRAWYYKQGLTAEVGSDLDYAVFIEQGTGPHMPPWSAIYAWALRICQGDKRRAGALAAGTRKSIAAHGTKPHPFLKPAAEAEMPNFLADLTRRLKEGT